jgi:hypothetical protein
MSNLVKHAKDELKRAGLFDKDSDYSGMMGDAVLELITVFSKQGHSGMSASMTRYIFNKLSGFEPITPLTNDPKEWMEVGEKMWQSKRNPSCFSTDEGKTYYDINDKKKKIKNTKVKK